MAEAAWRDAYERLLGRLPALAARARPVVALSSACVDACVALSDAPEGLVGEPEADRLLGLLRDRARAGVGGEVVHDWPGGPAWIERHFAVARSWGGAGPHAAMALTALGAPSLAALGDRSAAMLAVVPGDVPLAQGARVVPAREAVAGGQAGPEVFIVEYTAGVRAAGVVPPRSSRIILRFGNLGIEADPAFDALSADPGLGAGAGLLAGFQCVPRERLEAEGARVARVVAGWRRAGVGPVHLELAGYEGREDAVGALDRMRGAVTSVGMSESELRLYFGDGDPRDLLTRVGERFGLDRVCVHADGWAASATRGEPGRERLALMTGCLLAAARAEAGRAVRPLALPAGARIGAAPFKDARAPGGSTRGGWSLVACPSLYLAAPITTLGMGDTFAAGSLLVLGLAGEVADPLEPGGS